MDRRTARAWSACSSGFLASVWSRSRTVMIQDDCSVTLFSTTRRRLIFVENKLLYASRPASRPPLDLENQAVVRADGSYPPLYYTHSRKQADVTLVTYGGMAMVAEQAMQRLIEEYETRFDYLILTQLWPLDVDEIVESVGRTKRLVVLEENTPDYSVASAVISAVAQRISGGFACRAVGSRPVPLPSVRHLEHEVLPSISRVVESVVAIL